MFSPLTGIVINQQIADRHAAADRSRRRRFVRA